MQVGGWWGAVAVVGLGEEDDDDGESLQKLPHSFYFHWRCKPNLDWSFSVTTHG